MPKIFSLVIEFDDTIVLQVFRSCTDHSIKTDGSYAKTIREAIGKLKKDYKVRRISDNAIDSHLARLNFQEVE